MSWISEEDGRRDERGIHYGEIYDPPRAHPARISVLQFNATKTNVTFVDVYDDFIHCMSTVTQTGFFFRELTEMSVSFHRNCNQ